MNLKKTTLITSLLLVSQMSFAQNWERAFTKGDVTISAGYGMFSTDALSIAAVNNYEGLQGEYQPSSSGPIYLGCELHQKDNYIVGVSYSYVSAQSGAGLDNNLYLYQYKYTAHQFMVKYNLGWYNSAKFGGMLYSGVQVGLKIAKGETDYFDAVFVPNSEKYPYEISSTGTHLTILGIKGKILTNSALGFDMQIGAGAMGIFSAGLNYTIK